MTETLLDILSFLENAVWSYIGFPALMLVGIYLTFKSRFFQIRKFPEIVKTFYDFLTEPVAEGKGVHPLQAFFASIGGCVGVGNIVSICTAVQIGGPGALFWIWITAVVGMLVKYGEVYLAMKFRVATPTGYLGGPHYYLRRVFKTLFFPNLAALLLCIYGVEIYQFSVVTHSISYNANIPLWIVTPILLGLVMYAAIGGVKRVGNISAFIIPIFVVIYIGMGSYVLFMHADQLSSVFESVFTYAFTPHGALGGFVGSSLLMTISQGVRRGCYTGDLGIGYASVIHSETSVTSPEKQASLVIFEIFLDTFIICTTSVVLILATGLWAQPLDASLLVQTALAEYFPFMNFFMPFFLFILGYSTINAYFVVGLKCAEFLGPRRGKMLYLAYAAIALFVFSFVDSTGAQAIMALTGGLLLPLNAYGIYKLRNEIGFVDEKIEAPAEAAQ